MMTMTNKVLWSEGMFLQPQHFQQQNRYMEYLVHEKFTQMMALKWGIMDMTIQEELLELGKFSLSSVRGIFADGTIFNAPQHDKPPPPLNIPEGTHDCQVYLSLCVKQEGIPEACLDDKEKRYRYQSDTEEVSDNLRTTKHSAQLELGKLSTRFMLEGEDLSGFTNIPIARIKEVRSNKNVCLEKEYIPTCINISGHSGFHHFISQVHGLLQHRADMLSHRLTDTQQSATAEIADFLLLQVVNRFEPLFSHLTQQFIHPEQLYQILLPMMGELATFTHDKRRPIQLRHYQHDDLTNTFAVLFKEIRHGLSMVLEQNAVAINLSQRDYGIWVGEIIDQELFSQANFVLAVYADMPTEKVRNNFPNQAKVAAIEQIHQLVSRALPGIALHPMPVAPRQIPYHANFSYFMLDQSHECWQTLQQSGGIAFHVGGQYPGIKLELWAIKG